MGQKKFESYIYNRVDGSDEETIDILKHIAEQYDGRVKVSFQKNVGWKQSFLNLVYAADNVYDYYGFSDQDDIWQEDNLISCFDVAEHDGIQGP